MVFCTDVEFLSFSFFCLNLQRNQPFLGSKKKKKAGGANLLLRALPTPGVFLTVHPFPETWSWIPHCPVKFNVS